MSRRNRFLAACRLEAHDTVPVWFMRQAGRALPEYRARRGQGGILDDLRDPELAAELTLQPVDRYGVDAAVLFSDIVFPLAAGGVDIDIVQGTGPVVAEPFRTDKDLARLDGACAGTGLEPMAEAARLVANTCPVPLIGFAGGPFTLACYLVDGAPSRTWWRTRRLMLAEPAVFTHLAKRLVDIALVSLRAQVEAGAEAVQVFDSWIGALAPDEYEAAVLPATRRLFAALGDLGVPAIYFGTGTHPLLESMATSGASVISVDSRTGLAEARRRVGPGIALQGNLDPIVCLAPWEIVSERARAVIAEGAGSAGYVFNLSHGVLPHTDPATLERLVALVHEEGRLTPDGTLAAPVGSGTG